MKIAFVIISSLFTYCSYGQKELKKILFFNEDSITVRGCGGVLESDVLYFVSDTSKLGSKKSDYFIGVLCVDLYGDSFFQKGRRYLMTLNKDFNKIKSHMSPDAFATFYKLKRFYVLKAVKRLD